MEMKKIFAENLLRLRREAGLTQEQLAGKLGVSFQSVSKWENAAGYPDIELFPAIAAAFQVEIDALLGYKMQKLSTTHYERKYGQAEYYWGNQVWSGCYEVLKYLPPVRPLRLLDIGCGEGQAAVFFARNGYKVSAYDISEKGLEKGRQLAQMYGVEIDFFHADLLRYRLENDFDIIFSSGALQYIPPAYRKELTGNWKAHTKPGGIQIMNVFVEKPWLARPQDWEETEYFWRTGELFGFYHDWKLERMEETVFDCSSGGVLHQHCMDVMIARKGEGNEDYGID